MHLLFEELEVFLFNIKCFVIQFLKCWDQQFLIKNSEIWVHCAWSLMHCYTSELKILMFTYNSLREMPIYLRIAAVLCLWLQATDNTIIQMHLVWKNLRHFFFQYQVFRFSISWVSRFEGVKLCIVKQFSKLTRRLSLGRDD